MAKKQLWLLTGGNGAGKTTFYHSFLEKTGLPFINADKIAKGINPQNPEVISYQAAKLAAKLFNNMLTNGSSFVFETVFSHPSKIDFVALAKAHGFEIILVYIHLKNHTLNNARIAMRVEAGGHHVPDEKVQTRIPRTLENIKNTLPLVDIARFYDNSNTDHPYQTIAEIRQHKLTQQQNPLPTWAGVMLTGYL